MIEVIAFWPSYIHPEKRIFIGTLHIRLPEIGVDIRGCKIELKKGKIFATIPNSRYLNESSTQSAYPCFTFTDLEANQRFIKEFQEIAKRYIEDYAKNCPREIIDKRFSSVHKKPRLSPAAAIKTHGKKCVNIQTKVPAAGFPKKIIDTKKFVDLKPKKANNLRKKSWQG